MKQEIPDNALLKVKNGYYYGTTKGNSWWRRYAKDGWLARGNSAVWVDEEGIHFHRYLTKEAKSIKRGDITEVRMGKWHAGKWLGVPVLKISWKKEGRKLVSGFSVATGKQETLPWIEALEKMIR